MLVGLNPAALSVNRTNNTKAATTSIAKNQSNPAFCGLGLEEMAKNFGKADTFEGMVRYKFILPTKENVEELTNFLKNLVNMKGTDDEAIMCLQDVAEFWGIKH